MSNTLAKRKTRVAEGSLVSVSEFEWMKVAINVWHLVAWERDKEQHRLLGYVNYVSYDTGPNLGDVTLTYMAVAWDEKLREENSDTGYFSKLKAAQEWLESIVMENTSKPSRRAQMKVDVETAETTIENESGREQEGITVTCMRCDHSVEVYGTSDASVRRGCATLREECPNGEENYYQENG